MRIKSEDQIFDPKIRAQIIAEIDGPENRRRKEEAYRRYECFKDKTNRYVVELFLQHLEEETVKEMLCAISNISITKKVVDKLARVYNYGVQRLIQDDEESTKKIQDIDKALNLTTELKKTNRFLRLQKNVALYLKPCPVGDKWTVKPTPMNPYLYDVVEDYYDRTKPMVYVLSDFKPYLTTGYSLFDPGKRPLTAQSGIFLQAGDNKDQIIADNPEDQNADNKKTYIFWSDNYHFTCDNQGTILSDSQNKNNENPFGICPIINYSIDQDGSFWAQGGGDIVEGSILINSIVTHTLYAGIMQGYGQFFMSGENLPRKVKFGITQSILAEYKDQQPEPKAQFLNASPQLADLRGLIEMYIALLLTTNNLSTSGISAQLTGSRNVASGVALIIDKAESLEDVHDQQQVFLDKEPEIFEVMSKIVDTYGDAMVDELKSLALPEDFEKKFVVKFNEPQAIMTEAEKLNNLKLRQDLGLDSMLDLLKKEDPSLTQAQAEMKLEELLREQIKEQAMKQALMKEMGVEPVNPNQSNQDNQNPQNGGKGNQILSQIDMESSMT